MFLLALLNARLALYVHCPTVLSIRPVDANPDGVVRLRHAVAPFVFDGRFVPAKAL
jgi:hypothetical protein